MVVFWGMLTGAVAAIMLLIGNGRGDALAGLQNLTLLVAAPFVIVMVGMCMALMRDLRHDPLIVRGEIGVEAVGSAVIAGHEKYDGVARSGTTGAGGAAQGAGSARRTRRAAAWAQPQATVTPAPPWP